MTTAAPATITPTTSGSTTAPTPPGNTAAPTAPNAQARMDAIIKAAAKACNAPGKGQAPPENIAKYLPMLMKEMAALGLVSKNQLAAVIMLVYLELGNWIPREEDDSTAFKSNPEENGKYRGRGFTQLTHRSNYEKAGQVLGLDLLGNPGQANIPEIAAKIFFVYYMGKLGNPAVAPFAESGDYQNVRSCVNAGSPGNWGITGAKSIVTFAWETAIKELPEGASPDIVGVAPGATYGVSSCADGGSGANKSVVAAGATSQADALAYALGMHRLEMQKSHTVRLLLNASAQPEILKLEAQQKFRLVGLGEVQTIDLKTNLGKTEENKAPDDPIAQGQTGVKPATDKRGGKLPEPDITTPANISAQANDQSVANTPSRPPEPPHNDLRSNPIIRIKIGGVSAPAQSPSAGANSANSGNASNSGSGNNAIANGLNGVSPNGVNLAQAPGVADPQAIATGGKVSGKTNMFPTGVGAIEKTANKPVKTPTELIFDSTQGDILGNPRITSCSYQLNSTTVTLYDPDGSLAQQILKRGTLEAEIGFEDGFAVNKFVGDIQKVTRIIPNKVQVFAVDRSAKAKTPGTGTSSPLSNVNNADLPKETEATLAAGKVKEGKGSTPVTTVADTSNASTPDTSNAPTPQRLGFVQPGNSPLDVAVKEATQKGSVIVVSGNEVKEVAPGQAESSGIIISYSENPGLFIRPPEITKRNNFDLTSGYGTLTVKGFNVAGKQVVAATVVTPGSPAQHPTGTIVAPEWGAVKLADAIIPGGRFTWHIATSGGSRVPESKEVMQGIVDIAGYMIKWEKERGVTFEITSWYRDPASNAAVGGASGSMHLKGCAVDFYFEGMQAFHDKMYDTWTGGLAIKPGGFIHLDTGTQRRWTY